MSDLDLFVRTAVTVVVIMDPLGAVPIFLAVTAPMDPAARRRAARVPAALAAVVILGFAVAGEVVLTVLDISLPALQIAGGLLLGLLALELLQVGALEPEASDRPTLSLVSLGTPLLAGPGAIATTMVAMRRAESVSGVIAVLGALAVALLVVYVLLRFAAVVARFVSVAATAVVSRIMGLLTAAIAVQLVGAGVQAW